MSRTRSAAPNGPEVHDPTMGAFSDFDDEFGLIVGHPEAALPDFSLSILSQEQEPKNQEFEFLCF